VQTIRYPREHMHRIAYTKLTERQIAEMARLQGDGFVVLQERRVLTTSFVKRDGIWQFSNAELQA
jgi:hypothetical protein